jgi:Tol biopolymer transport system component
MRQSFLLCSIIFLLAACAALPPTPAPPAPPDAPRPTLLAQATLARPTTTTERAADAPTPTRAPTETPTLLPTVTPVPAQFTQLMDGGCCVNPGWLPDSQNIVFIDKPQADAPVGMYRVDLSKPKASALWSERIAFYTRDFEYAQIPEPAGTRLIRTSDGQEWRIQNGGRSVQISPDRTRIVWTETRETFPLEKRISNIMLANLDGSEPQRILQVLRGGVSGWLDNHRLLVNGRASQDTFDTTLFVYDLRDESQTKIVQAERIRLTAPSPDGNWIVYALTNEADAARSGLWLARADGTETRKLDFFGPVQWRDAAHLIYAPFEMDAPHAFFEYDVEAGETRRLTPPDQPFTIASGDWSVSPDGKKIVLVNAADNNLWLWQFPE